MPKFNTDYVLDAAEQAKIISAIQTLDTGGTGVNPGQLRPILGNTGWTKIIATIYSMEEAGKLKRTLRGSPVPLEYFSVV